MRLDFPLDIDDKTTILNSLFFKGETQLVNGSKTIQGNKISINSIAFVSRKTAIGGIGDLSINCFNGYATITSSSSSDNSKVYYLILI